MQKINKILLSMVIVFSLSILVGVYVYKIYISAQNKKAALNVYLITSIKTVLEQEPEQRGRGDLKKLMILNGLNKIEQLSENNKYYYWFDVSSNIADDLRPAILNERNTNFAGYYLETDTDGNVVGFGYHKP